MRTTHDACLAVVTFMFFNDKMMAAMSRCTGENEYKKEEEEEEEGGDSPIAKALARPLFLAFEVTIPNCSLPHNKGRYLITFFASIFWIGVLSYFLVTWASKLGCIWGIHPAIMGVTVLAARCLLASRRAVVIAPLVEPRFHGPEPGLDVVPLGAA